MDFEKGYSTLHFLIAAVLMITVALGSFATVTALESMAESEMSEVTGQEGMVVDIHLSSTFKINNVLWQDNTGATAAGNTTGVLGLFSISPTGSTELLLNGVTIDADGATSVGTSTTGAVVIGIPNIPTGIQLGDVDPGNTTLGTTTDASTNSIGAFELNGINSAGSRVEVAANN